MDDAPVSPEEVAHRGFATAFRGFDTTEVRSYLQRVANELRASVARERELHRRLADAEHRAAHPVLEGDALTSVLGDEMGRILGTAQKAAQELRGRAEENAARILREGHEQAQRIRAEAEAVLAVRTEEAEVAAAEIRGAAQAEAAATVEAARREAAATIEDVEGRARQLVQDAQAARARVVADLTRRRRIVQAQVDQLRAGRDRLLDAYRVVRRTLDEVADELERVEEEAREAAEAAGERAQAELDQDEGTEAADEVPAPRPPAVAADPAPPRPPAAPPPLPSAPPDAAGETTRPPATTDGAAPPPPPVVAAPAAPAPPRPPAAPPTPADPLPAGAATSPPPEIDELFARIRAGRAEAVARAEKVLAAEERAPEAGAGDAEAPDAGDAAPAPAPEDGGSVESVLQRRDAAVEGLEVKLARKLKRALQDEQNEVLDRLRSRRPGDHAAGALPPADEQAGRYRVVAAEVLEEAAAAGARFVARAGDVRADGDAVDDVAAELAESLAAALHRALEAAVAGERGAEEASVVNERIGAAYRGFKAQRIEGLAGDAVTAAFARGTVAASAPGAALRWVVDDEGRPCPDCDDNALAGPTAPGDPFPTGQPHPPAHAGCRCLLAPARLTTAVAEAG